MKFQSNLLFVIFQLQFYFNFIVTNESSVLNYDTDQFEELVSKSNHYVLFYTPWSGSYKSISQIWEEIGEKFKSTDLVVAKIDCSKNSGLCSKQGISEEVSIRIYKTGSELKTKLDTGLSFKGNRDFKSLQKFANTQIKIGEKVYGARDDKPKSPESVNGLYHLNDDNFDDLVTDGHAFVKFCTPWMSKCMDLIPVWTQLAEDFILEDDLLIGEVDCSQTKSICNENEVRGYPTLLWLTDGLVVEKYPSKARDVASLSKYTLEKLKRSGTVRAILEEKLKTIPTAIVPLSNDNFTNYVNSQKLSFVLYFTPWSFQSQKLSLTWFDLGQEFKDNKDVSICKVDCTKNREICDEEQIEDFPTLLMYRNGVLETPYAKAMKLKDMTEFVYAALGYEKDEL